MKKEYINLPNALSLSRAVFLPLLFIFVILDMRTAFLIGYIILGSTDMFDGLIARKFNLKTDLGKVLDSAADLLFYLSTAWFIYRLYPQYLEPNMLLLNIFFAILLLSFLISLVVCKKPIMMHTFLLRLGAVFVYFAVILSYFIDTTYFIAAIIIFYIVAFTEEIIIFIKYGKVDPDTPSLLSLKPRKDNSNITG